MKPKVCILRSDGTNCDNELFYAFEKAGAVCEFVHINELRNKEKQLSSFQILALPGGFSYGDDLASGKVLAIELMHFFAQDLQKFIQKKGFILGVCNGFQTLIRTGLLPFGDTNSMRATLTHNSSGHFECRWIEIKTESSSASYLNNLPTMSVPVNHGEGKFYASEAILDRIEKEKLVVFRYVDEKGKSTMDYPQNPNGALNAIAGIADKTGRILGLMPHPEKFVDITQHPNWRRGDYKNPQGLPFFERIVSFVSQS
jgi:phosphoribosylformylglycinamidine synthase